MAEAINRAELVQHFGEAAGKHEDVMAECLSICRIYDLPPSELYYKWEAFTLNHIPAPGAGSGSEGSALPTLTLDNARALKRVIQRDMETKRSASAANGANASSFGTPKRSAAMPLGSASKSGKKMGAAGLGDLLGINPATPLARKQFPGSALGPGQAGDTPSRSPLETPSRPVPNYTGSSPFALPDEMQGVEQSPSGAAREPLMVLETLNPHLKQAAGPGSASTSNGVPPKSRVGLAVGTDPRAWGYRYMYERAGAKADVLDDRIDEFAELIRQHHGIEEDLGDPAMASQEPIYAVGRVCPGFPSPSTSRDGAADDTPGLPKLSDTGVMLESSRMMGSGARVPLVFEPDCLVRGAPFVQGGVGLFPGMLVGVRGKNGGGERFAVQEVLLPPAQPHAATSRSELLSNQYSPTRLGGNDLSVLTAAGPYTPDANLDFVPWHRLMDEVERECPDVLLLMGPFLDASHPLLVSGDVDEMPAGIFRRHISARLAKLGEVCPATTAILIPSTKDIVSAHAAFPQPMLDKSAEAGLGLPKRVKCLPNPSLFSINEVVVAASTADVLRDLRAEEYVQRIDDGSSANSNAGARDTMARLCRHVIGQRSFYPLFPAPPSSSLPLDTTHAHLHTISGVTPDILLLPSMLRHFARVVDSTTVVNPGFCARKAAKNGEGGSLARFGIGSMKREELEEGDQEEVVGHRVYERARVDIVRL